MPRRNLNEGERLQLENAGRKDTDSGPASPTKMRLEKRNAAKTSSPKTTAGPKEVAKTEEIQALGKKDDRDPQSAPGKSPKLSIMPTSGPQTPKTTVASLKDAATGFTSPVVQGFTKGVGNLVGWASNADRKRSPLSKNIAGSFPETPEKYSNYRPAKVEDAPDSPRSPNSAHKSRGDSSNPFESDGPKQPSQRAPEIDKGSKFELTSLERVLSEWESRFRLLASVGNDDETLPMFTKSMRFFQKGSEDYRDGWLDDLCVRGGILCAGPSCLPSGIRLIDTVSMQPLDGEWSLKKISTAEIPSIRRIVFPLHVGGNHWLTAVADLLEQEKSVEKGTIKAKVELLSSLGGIEEGKQYVEKFLKTAFKGFKILLKFKVIDIGRQPNGDECGVITIANCISALEMREYEKEYTEAWANQKRFEYAKAIYNSAIARPQHYLPESGDASSSEGEFEILGGTGVPGAEKNTEEEAGNTGKEAGNTEEEAGEGSPQESDTECDYTIYSAHASPPPPPSPPPSKLAYTHDFEEPIWDIDRRYPEKVEKEDLIRKFIVDILNPHFVIARCEEGYGRSRTYPCYDTVARKPFLSEVQRWRNKSKRQFSERGDVKNLDVEDIDDIKLLGVTSVFQRLKSQVNEVGERITKVPERNAVTHILLKIPKSTKPMWYIISDVVNKLGGSYSQIIHQHRVKTGQYMPKPPPHWVTEMKKTGAYENVSKPVETQPRSRYPARRAKQPWPQFEPTEDQQQTTLPINKAVALAMDGAGIRRGTKNVPFSDPARWWQEDFDGVLEERKKIRKLLPITSSARSKAFHHHLRNILGALARMVVNSLPGARLTHTRELQRVIEALYRPGIESHERERTWRRADQLIYLIDANYEEAYEFQRHKEPEDTVQKESEPDYKRLYEETMEKIQAFEGRVMMMSPDTSREQSAE